MWIERTEERWCVWKDCPGAILTREDKIKGFQPSMKFHHLFTVQREGSVRHIKMEPGKWEQLDLPTQLEVAARKDYIELDLRDRIAERYPQYRLSRAEEEYSERMASHRVDRAVHGAALGLALSLAFIGLTRNRRSLHMVGVQVASFCCLPVFVGMNACTFGTAETIRMWTECEEELGVERRRALTLAQSWTGPADAGASAGAGKDADKAKAGPVPIPLSFMAEFVRSERPNSK
jgi:hypothetical protein